MSVPVLSRSLIDDRTESLPPPPVKEVLGGSAKQWRSTEILERDRVRPPPRLALWRRTRPGPPVDAPASRAEPDHPDPQSQSLSRSYGSNLPTSLTHIILSTRGCSPWRPAADMGTSWCESAVISLGFSRSHQALVDAARTAALFAKNQNPFSLREDSRASAAYAEKTTLPRAPVGVS